MDANNLNICGSHTLQMKGKNAFCNECGFVIEDVKKLEIELGKELYKKFRKGIYKEIKPSNKITIYEKFERTNTGEIIKHISFDMEKWYPLRTPYKNIPHSIFNPKDS